MCKDQAIFLSQTVGYRIYPIVVVAPVLFAVCMYLTYPTHFTALVHKCKQAKLGQSPFNTTESGEAAIMNYP